MSLADDQEAVRNFKVTDKELILPLEATVAVYSGGWRRGFTRSGSSVAGDGSGRKEDMDAWAKEVAKVTLHATQHSDDSVVGEGRGEPGRWIAGKRAKALLLTEKPVERGHERLFAFRMLAVKVARVKRSMVDGKHLAHVAKRNGAHPFVVPVRIVAGAAGSGGSVVGGDGVHVGGVEKVMSFVEKKDEGGKKVGIEDEDDGDEGTTTGIKDVYAVIKDKKVRNFLLQVNAVKCPCVASVLLACVPVGSATASPSSKKKSDDDEENGGAAGDDSTSDAFSVTFFHGLSHRGTLVDVMNSILFPLNPTIKSSICRDILSGCMHLNGLSVAGSDTIKNEIAGPHGCLSPFFCYVDAGFRVKIGGFGVRVLGGYLGSALGKEKKVDGAATSTWGLDGDNLRWNGGEGRDVHELFVSPEVLRGGLVAAVETSDVYSLAVLFNYIFSDGVVPYSDMRPLDAAAKLKAEAVGTEGKFRPTVASSISDDLRQIIVQSWSQRPASRPSLEDLHSRLHRIDSTLQTLPLDSSETASKLQALYLQDQTNFTLQTLHHQSHQSLREKETISHQWSDSEALRKKAEGKCMDLQNALNTEKETGHKNIQRLRDELAKTQEEAAAEALRLRQVMGSIQREAVAARNGLLPRPIAEIVVAQTLAAIAAAATHPVDQQSVTRRASKMEQQQPRRGLSVNLGGGGPNVGGPSSVIDLVFQPTVYDSATMLVVSISGFNRYIQQLSTAPRLLLDLLKSYYDAIDEAIESSALARPAIIFPSQLNEPSAVPGIHVLGSDGSEDDVNGGTGGTGEGLLNSYYSDASPLSPSFPQTVSAVPSGLPQPSSSGPKGIGGRVHVVERICDACILVGGAPDRTDNHAEDVIDVGVRLLAWSLRWDASHILGGTNARVNIRVGIHSGPVTAGIIGQMPKFLLMGETVNLASGIESLCNVQEIRVSSVTQSLLAGRGYKFEPRGEIDLRSRGKMGTFALVATPNGPIIPGR
ncbi:hypothetical protein HDU97_005801 [Phlyctochytrium planicorne]|nr:hypothetical protein HDU97_005801 [Phlyctochytrium planicorne]